MQQGNHAFLFEPRCGKSKAALDAMAEQFECGVVERVVIIAPLSVLSVWEDQILEHLSVSAKVAITGGKPWYVDRGTKKRLLIYLINYDKFSRRGDDETYRNDYLKAVEKWRPDLLVLDESHRVKSAGAVRSQSLWRSVSRLRKSRGNGRPFVYLLTGTPNPKGYIDLFAQFRILDERIFGTNKLDFEERYVQYGFGRRKYTIVRYLHKEEILSKVAEHSTIVTAARAGLAGVESIEQIRVELPPNARSMYRELSEELVAEIESELITGTNPGVRRLRLLQITGGFTTEGVQIHDAKVRILRDYLQDLYEQGESVVVYARFLPEVRACAAVAKKLGFGTNVITGATKRSDRADFIRTFQRGGSPKVLVFQPQAGSLGIELTAAAETVFYSLPDGWETFFQCLQRTKGPKQKRPVRHTFILAKRTLDQSVLVALRNKRDMHREMMKNPRNFMEGL